MNKGEEEICTERKWQLHTYTYVVKEVHRKLTMWRKWHLCLSAQCNDSKWVACIDIRTPHTQKTKANLPWLAVATVLSHDWSGQPDMPVDVRLASAMTSGCVLLCFTKPDSRAANSAEHAPPKTGTEPVGTSCLRWMTQDSKSVRRGSVRQDFVFQHQLLCSCANTAVCFVEKCAFLGI